MLQNKRQNRRFYSMPKLGNFLNYKASISVGNEGDLYGKSHSSGFHANPGNFVSFEAAIKPLPFGL